ncbi:MAG: hypothetical protein M3Y56_04325, partial [Armatimonadota bacterium]|nr:hypothetical protein [Armatimonadota bacterium]
YKDWIQKLDGVDFHDVFGEEPERLVYLLPEARDGEHFESILKRYFSAIFENELSGWNIDKATWPARRGWQTFRAWFHVEYSSVVADMDSHPLIIEEF